MAATDTPPAIVAPQTSPTTFEKVALASLSIVDVASTEAWLSNPRCADCHENDPLLGRHPSLLRMAATGVAIDELVLHVRSPFLRRLAIGIEAANVGRQLSLKVRM